MPLEDHLDVILKGGLLPVRLVKVDREPFECQIRKKNRVGTWDIKNNEERVAYVKKTTCGKSG